MWHGFGERGRGWRELADDADRNDRRNGRGGRPSAKLRARVQGPEARSGSRGCGSLTWRKRLFDLVLLALLSVVFVPVALIVAVIVWWRDGWPVIYVSERMRSPTQAFGLLKFRTMTAEAEDGGISGGHKAARITPLGAILRAGRMDELPQLWNVLRGDISFVGPRPPLRSVVERYPEIYAEVLKSRPGITGLASVVFHEHEAWLLRDCKTAAEATAVYDRRCVPRKARLDLIYQRNRSLCLDLWLIWWTAARAIGYHRRKARRSR